MEGARPRVSSSVTSCSLAKFPPLAAAVSLLVKQEDWTGQQAGLVQLVRGMAVRKGAVQNGWEREAV